MTPIQEYNYYIFRIILVFKFLLIYSYIRIRIVGLWFKRPVKGAGYKSNDMAWPHQPEVEALSINETQRRDNSMQILRRFWIALALITTLSLTLSQVAFGWGGSSGDSWSSSDSTSGWSSGDSTSGWSSGDSTGGWTAEDCRSCHDDWQNLPLQFSNVDNHHKLIGTPVNHPTAPNAELSDHYVCTSCHVVPLDGNFSAERDCLQCHDVNTVANRYRGNRHHDTDTARSRRCSTCHSRMPGGRSWR